MMSTINIDGQEKDIDVENNIDLTGLTLPDLSESDWRYGADDCFESGNSNVYQWNLSEIVRLYVDVDQGYVVGVVATKETIGQHLLDWDYDCDTAEWLSSWGLDGAEILSPADADFQGACRVWVEPNYYQGTYGAPVAGFARDEQGNILEFENGSKAAAYVSEYYNAPSGYDGIPACNVLSHGQAGADSLKIVQA